MASFTRVQARQSLEVDVSASDYWDVLLDWPAVGTWMPKENTPVPLIKVELRPGHEPGKLPCTRDCYFAGGNGVVPVLVAETLLHVDPEAMMIYYNMEGEGPLGMRNYLATTTVDALPGDRARVTCSSRFDMANAEDVETARNLIETIYETAIIRGIEALIKRNKT